MLFILTPLCPICCVILRIVVKIYVRLLSFFEDSYNDFYELILTIPDIAQLMTVVLMIVANYA